MARENLKKARQAAGMTQQQREDRLNSSLGTGNMDNPQSIHIG